MVPFFHILRANGPPFLMAQRRVSSTTLLHRLACPPEISYSGRGGSGRDHRHRGSLPTRAPTRKAQYPRLPDTNEPGRCAHWEGRTAPRKVFFCPPGQWERNRSGDALAVSLRHSQKRLTSSLVHLCGGTLDQPHSCRACRVRIEGARVSNPLSSTEILKVRGLFEFLWLYMGSRCGSQVVTLGMAEAKRCGYGEDGIYFDHRGNCRELGPHVGDLHADHPGAGRDTRGPPPGLLVTVDRPRPRLRHQRSKRRGIG
jgi:hypothetical protein